MAAIPRKQRAMVRKGIQAGLTSELDDGIDRFYRAYSESVRNLGTPVFGKRYFQILKEVFGADCEVLTITSGGGLVASVLSFYFRDEVLPYYGGGTDEARAVKGNDFMYWELMRRAAERGVKVFDYGRSKVGTGSYGFKKNWGFEPEPLHYEYHLVRADRVPDVNPLNPKYRLFIAAWKRLPLAVSRLIGPMIARSLG
jgi:FemAB-related protein (PEP-CTERM system-associated)